MAVPVGAGCGGPERPYGRQRGNGGEATGGVMREVVGVDGSEVALAAVRWAAADAALHRTTLRLVCAAPRTPGELGPEATRQGTSMVTDERLRWLSKAASTAAVAAADLDIEQEVREGDPGAVLLEESEHARRLVVGTRGLGEFTGVQLALGSTAELVAMRARCPVVVVPEAVDLEGTAQRPVIVGVDGSRVGEPAVAVAFAEASDRRVPLVAVHVWSDVAVDEWFTDDSRDWESISQAEERVLAERLAGWQERYPEVPVRRVVARDRPVRYLVEHGAEGQLIVVGSRGRGSMTGMMLGSTSRALLHCAPCPLMVVRGSED